MFRRFMHVPHLRSYATHVQVAHEKYAHLRGCVRVRCHCGF